MRKAFILTIIIIFCGFMAESQTKILLATDNQVMTATLADTDAARQLFSRLNQAPVTIDMSEYGGFEMVGQLPWSLDTSDRQLSTLPGDIMLYQGDKIVIFYGKNSWSYTPLGKIDGATASNVKEFLGKGKSVKLTVSLTANSGISAVTPDESETDVIYDLHGNRLKKDNIPPGIYIKNGKKIVLR